MYNIIQTISTNPWSVNQKAQPHVYPWISIPLKRKDPKIKNTHFSLYFLPVVLFINLQHIIMVWVAEFWWYWHTTEMSSPEYDGIKWYPGLWCWKLQKSTFEKALLQFLNVIQRLCHEQFNVGTIFSLPNRTTPANRFMAQREACICSRTRDFHTRQPRR